MLRKRGADKRDPETKSEKINDSNLSKVREVTQACRLLFAGSFRRPVSIQFGRQHNDAAARIEPVSEASRKAQRLAQWTFRSEIER
jgi:hypothetical protein